VDAVTAFAEEQGFHVGPYDRLAVSLGMSISSLRRRVMETTGMSLHQFVRTLRMGSARRLLRQTDKSLAEIATELGFTDVYYFNREFSRLAGISPAAYRKSEL